MGLRLVRECCLLVLVSLAFFLAAAMNMGLGIGRWYLDSVSASQVASRSSLGNAVFSALDVGDCRPNSSDESLLAAF